MQNEMIDRPAARYGGSRPTRWSRRRTVLVVTTLAVAVGVAVAVLAYNRLGTSEVKGELAGYRIVDDHAVEVTISVTREDPSRPVACIVRGRSRDGDETGRRELLIPPSRAQTVQVTATVETSKPAAVGDVYGCGTDVPAYLKPGAR